LSEDELDLENGPAPLRDAYKQIKKDLAKAQEELGTYRAQARSSAVTSALKAKGLDEAKAAKVAGFYQNEDTSETAVASWLEANADIFGVAATPAATPAPADPNADAASRVLSAAFSEAGPVAKAGNQVLGSPEEVTRLIQTLPYETLVKEWGFPPQPKY